MNEATKVLVISAVKDAVLDIVILVAGKVAESAKELKKKSEQQGSNGPTTN